jgi:hypothetical protein
MNPNTDRQPKRAPDRQPKLSALPSSTARLLAFAAVILGGICGGVIGAAVVGVQCVGRCSTGRSVGGLIGAVTVAGGVAILAVLALRAMGEWRNVTLQEIDREIRIGHQSLHSPERDTDEPNDGSEGVT